MLDWLLFLPVCESFYTSKIDDEAAIGFLDTAALTIFSYFFSIPFQDCSIIS